MFMQTKRLFTLAVCALSATACGDDTKNAQPERTSTEAGASASPSDGGGGTSSSPGADASRLPASGGLDAGRQDPTGFPMQTPAEPVRCGSATCEAPAGFGGAPGGGAIPGGMGGGFPGGPSACCIDAAKGSCGIQGMTGTCEPKPTPDPRCPVLTGGPGDLTGCCTNSGMCGADVSMFGAGCAPLSDEMLRRFFSDAPAPRRCDGQPLSDAGAADAGLVSTPASFDGGALDAG